MKLEDIFEAKRGSKRQEVKRDNEANPKGRDFASKNLGQNTGGAHRSKKDYKRKEKHAGRKSFMESIAE